MNTKFFLYFIFAVLLLSCMPQVTHAATLYFDKPAYHYGVGDTFTLALKLDTEGEVVNAISAQIVVPDALVSIVTVSDANSPVTTWVTRPQISGNSISFAGIMPGGFTDVIDPVTKEKFNSTIVTITLKITGAGSDSIIFNESSLYKNDGRGTKADLVAVPLRLSFGDSPTGADVIQSDITPPEFFTAVVTSDKNLFAGRYALIFSTTDKGSGISYYEVKEGDNPFVRAESPYELTDQTLRSHIKVRAVDYAGNERIIDVKSGISREVLFGIFVLLGVLVLSIIALWYVVKKYKK